VTGKTQQATRSLGGRPAAADASASWCSRLVVTLRRSFPSEADLPGQVLALSIPAALVSLPLYGAIYAVRGEYLIAFLHALALGAILFVRRFWKILDRPAWALHTLVLCLSGVLAPTIYLEGGLMSTSAPWLLLLPALFVIAGFLRGALIWFGVVTVFLLVLLYLASNGHVFPTLQQPQPLYTRVTDILFLIITVCGFTLLTQRARRAATRQLKRRNVELSSARDAAVEASRVKAQFLANMSHEIRTPMNGVIGSTELLAATPLNAEQRQLLQTLRQSGETLLALINDVLDFSKIEAGKLSLDRARFNPRESAEHVAALLAPQATAKGLELTCRVAADVPSSVVGDSLRLRQILTNLCGNAIKFTAKGEVALEMVRIPADCVQHVRLRCVVEDTGIGIAPEQVPRLFQPFTQADGSTTRLYGGSGLGLAISNELAAMMNGRIDVQSKVGVGSRFSCVLEFEASDDAGTSYSVPTGLRVALLEPHPRTRAAVAEQLQMLGVEIVHDVAATGPSALDEALKSNATGIFVAASTLAELTRLHDPECLRAVSDARRRIVVLAHSGTSGEGLLEVRGLHVLHKPVALYALVRALNQLAKPAGEEMWPTVEIARMRSAHVLVAEDNPVNQRLVAAMLEKLGHTVEVAGDGAVAVAAWSRAPFDVVMMDCQMPIIDGYQATRQIRAHEAEFNRRRTPIVALTANALNGDREQCLAAGMDDYIAKPLTLTKLQQALVRAIGKA